MGTLEYKNKKRNRKVAEFIMSLKDKKYIKDTFCIAPWTEIHFGVGKEVMPCCTYTRYNPFGNLNDTDDIQEIYNSDNAKSLRKKLFNGEKAKECGSCWKQEELSKNESYRQFHNEFYGKYIDKVLENTNEDFSLKSIQPKRLDIRFDNKCNLKCRICNSNFSTSWYSDEVKLGIKSEEKIDVYKESISPKVMNFIVDSIPHVDEIFFAGGEPLIQDNHYKILNAAIQTGYSKNIRLTYNTNFSSLKYKKNDIISLWKKFQFVNIGASLDASHKQGEYQRKNIIWSEVEKNRKKLLKELPDVNFEIIPTLSILNVYNILNFHKEWVDKKFILPNDIKINLLTEPLSYDIRNLPDYHKDRITKLYNEHIEWLQSLKNAGLAINEFKKVLKYLSQPSDISKLKKFIDYNVKLDEIREESFFNIYPEFSDLEWYLKYQSLKDDVGELAISTIGSQKEKIQKQAEFLIKANIEIDKLNKKIAEKDSFISKTLHETGYVKELEMIRDKLNKKLAEKDSFISKLIHETQYIKSLEVVRDNLNKKVAEKDSFINKTLIDTNYLKEVTQLKNKLKEISDDNQNQINEIFDEVSKISNRLTERINQINRENGYKALL